MRIMCALMAAFATASVAHADVSLGLAKDNAWNSSEHIARMESHGLTGHGTVYYTLTSEANRANPYDWVRINYVEADIPLVMTLIIDDRSDPNTSTVGTSEGTDVSAGIPGLLQRVINEDFDDDLRELAAEVRDDGTPITIRPFHELDGGWYEWGIYAVGNSSELAVAAVAHIINVFDEVGAENVSWEINFNRRDGRGQVLGEAEYLIPALNELVDAYSVSTYNRCGTSARYEEERSFSADFVPIYERITALSSLPVNLAEVSTSGICAPRIEWFADMLDDLENFPQLEMVTFFFGVVPVGRASNDVEIFWGFDQQPELLPQFRELITGQQEASVEMTDEAPVALPVPRPAPREVHIVRPVAPTYIPSPPRVETRVEEVQVVQTGPLGFDSMPWSVWGRLSFPLYEEGNPALNTVTGNPFGETGPVLRFTLQQRFLWDEGDFEHGPGLVASGAFSNNDNQWWNNQVTAGVTYGLYGDFPRNSLNWGGWSAEFFAGHREYFAPTPDRLGGGEGIVELRFGVNFGGDWLQ